VAPFGAAQRRFSTNPICVGVPTSDGLLLLDFATSMVAEGKVLVAANGGKKLPAGALIDPDGRLSTDPHSLYGATGRDARNGKGALRAFGDHKGSGLSFMCEILAGCLSGGNTATQRPPDGGPGIVNNMLSIYLDPGNFGAAHFADTAREFAQTVKGARPAEPGGEVLVPGEPESRTRARRLVEGIPLQADTWAAIRETGNSLGVKLPN
jgi:uncharacterized oxidoreductase